MLYAEASLRISNGVQTQNITLLRRMQSELDWSKTYTAVGR